MTSITTNTNSADLPELATREPVPATVSRRAGILILIGGAFALADCGGGGGGSVGGGGAASVDLGGISPGDPGSAATTTGDTSVAGVSSGGTGSVSVGSVTGFGSIIVNDNGVRIDDSSATITDEDGVNLKGKLKLGMQVVSVGTVSTTGAVTAQTIVASGQLLGRIENLPNFPDNDGTFSFDVLGQKIKVVASTVFDVSLSGGFASLIDGDIVEIHGLLDAKHNILTANFIEKKPLATYFKIIGFVNDISNSSTNFKIGGLEISTASLLPLPARGKLVRVHLNTQPPGTRALGTGVVWLATRIAGIEILAQDRDSFEIQGRISSYTSPTSFSVAGVPVVIPGNLAIDNPGSVILDINAVGAPPDAPILEVKGRLVNGVLTASSAKVESESGQASLEFELHGSISSLSANGNSGSFTLGAFTVSYGPATTYVSPGTVANLTSNVSVEVKGTLVTGSTTAITATRIRFS